MAAQLLGARLAALPQGERTTACFADFAAAGTAMKAEGDARLDAAQDLKAQMRMAGLQTSPDRDVQADEATYHTNGPGV